MKFLLLTFFFLFFWLHLWHMEVPRAAAEAYTTATAMLDPSCICNLQRKLLATLDPKPQTANRDQNHIFTGVSWVLSPLSDNGNSLFNFKYIKLHIMDQRFQKFSVRRLRVRGSNSCIFKVIIGKCQKKLFLLQVGHHQPHDSLCSQPQRTQPEIYNIIKKSV